MTRIAALLATGLVLATLASLAFGARSIEPMTVIEAVFDPDPDSTDHLVVRELRWPRTVLGLMVGAALGVAGTITQAVTRNPLGDPGVLGINAGAALAVVSAIALFDLARIGDMVWFGYAGAAAAALLVYSLGASTIGPSSAVRLTLAGAAVTALFVSLTSTIALLDDAALDRFRFWVVGSLADRADSVTPVVMVPIAAGLVVAMLMGRALNAAALGDDAAQGLGANPQRIRIAAFVVVTVLAGAAVAAAGPIAFVGLIAPHTMRSWVGSDHHRLLPTSAAFGAVLLVLCDVAGRLAIRPGELRVGITTAAIGGPVFVLVARRARVIPSS